MKDIYIAPEASWKLEANITTNNIRGFHLYPPGRPGVESRYPNWDKWHCIVDAGHYNLDTSRHVTRYGSTAQEAINAALTAAVMSHKPKCIVESCRDYCTVLPTGKEVLRASQEALCTICGESLISHQKFAYPSGMGHCVRDCEGRYLHF